MDSLTIRGISDLADGAKASADARGSQQIAASHAAAAAMAVIAALPGDLVEATPAGGSEHADGPLSPAPPTLRQINKADRKGVVNAVQNGNQSITNGPRATPR